MSGRSTRGRFPDLRRPEAAQLVRDARFCRQEHQAVPEFAVDPDPRTGIEICDSVGGPSSPEPRICVRNPVRTLDIEVSDVAPPPADQSIRFQDQYYTVVDTRWDRAAFMILYELFQVTVTDVSRIGIPITIAR